MSWYKDMPSSRLKHCTQHQALELSENASGCLLQIFGRPSWSTRQPQCFAVVASSTYLAQRLCIEAEQQVPLRKRFNGNFVVIATTRLLPWLSVAAEQGKVPVAPLGMPKTTTAGRDLAVGLASRAEPRRIAAAPKTSGIFSCRRNRGPNLLSRFLRPPHVHRCRKVLWGSLHVC